MALKKCHECGQKVSQTAKACPNCGAPHKKKSKPLGTMLIIIAVVILAGVLLQPGSEENPIVISNKQISVDPQLEKTIQEWITTGAVHSVNVEFNEVRVDPIIWVPLPIENKQNFVTMFSRYFDAKGSTGRVEVLSNRNDKRLATYSVWSGIKILE